MAELSTAKENTKIKVANGVPEKEALMPKSINSLGQL